MKKWPEKHKSREQPGLNQARPDVNIGANQVMKRTLKPIPYAILCLGLTAATVPRAPAQQGFFTRDDVIMYTPDWHGDRFPDGRPKVPDDILDRMKPVTLAEAWAVPQQNSCMPQ